MIFHPDDSTGVVSVSDSGVPLSSCPRQEAADEGQVVEGRIKLGRLIEGRLDGLRK